MWIRVWYVKQLAASPGAFPRRQELPPGTYITGVPRVGMRRFVVSHGWETEVHPSPSGFKMQKLEKALTQVGAHDDDVVFFDFCSNTQENKMGKMWAKDTPYKDQKARDATAAPYFRYNKIENSDAAFPNRGKHQKRVFNYAMYDMGRLYSHHSCEVLILPTLSSELPGGSVWGDINDHPYQQRGWCFAEFSIALKHNRISNLHDDNVQAVLKSRPWPKTVAEYATMMRDDQPAHLRIRFTSKGDAAKVKYNFFRMGGFKLDFDKLDFSDNTK